MPLLQCCDKAACAISRAAHTALALHCILRLQLLLTKASDERELAWQYLNRHPCGQAAVCWHPGEGELHIAYIRPTSDVGITYPDCQHLHPETSLLTLKAM